MNEPTDRIDWPVTARVPNPTKMLDIVFLVDKTRSMGRSIEALVHGIGHVLEYISAINTRAGRGVISWRAKVAGYGDVEADAENWWKEAPFRGGDVTQVKADLAALQPASGGGDDAESLLDALFKICMMGSTPEGADPAPSQWRGGRVKRVAVVFSDAPSHEICALPEANGADWTQVGNLLLEKRLRLFMCVPSDASNIRFDALPDTWIVPAGQYSRGTGDSTRAMEALCDATRAMPAELGEPRHVLDILLGVLF